MADNETKVQSLLSTFVSTESREPLYITALLPTGNHYMTEGGVPTLQYRKLHFVNMEKMPQELRERVVTFIQMNSRP